jgi:hypothetical protein
MERLRTYVVSMCMMYPLIATDIGELFQWCLDEIESGESEYNEIEICYSAIADLLEEEKVHINNVIDNI